MINQNFLLLSSLHLLGEFAPGGFLVGLDFLATLGGEQFHIFTQVQQLPSNYSQHVL